MGDLGAWLSLLIIAVLVWKQGSKVLAPVVQPCLRFVSWGYSSLRGNFGPELVEPELPPESGAVTASESQSYQSNQVTEVTLSDLEIAWIAHELGRGTSASAVAKQLPGYSPKRYDEYTGRVGLVEALLAEKSATEAERAARKAARMSGQSAGTMRAGEQSV